MARLFTLLQGLLRECRPTALAVETPFVGLSPRSALTLGQAHGIVLLAGALEGLAVATYPPAAVKAAVAGSGGAPKDQVRRMVEAILPRARPAGEDAGDALAVALCHAFRRPFQEALARSETKRERP